MVANITCSSAVKSRVQTSSRSPSSKPKTSRWLFPFRNHKQEMKLWNYEHKHTDITLDIEQSHVLVSVSFE